MASPLGRQFAKAVREVIAEDGLAVGTAGEHNSSRIRVETRNGVLWLNVYPLPHGWQRAIIYKEGSAQERFEYDFKPMFGRWLPWGIKRRIRKYLVKIMYLFLDLPV